MIVEELSPEDRKLLEKKYFLVWTVYKRMLIGLAILFGSLWIWTGWEALHDTQLVDVFVIITIVVVALLAFGWLSTPIYRKKTALPLEQDILQNQKICKTGIIIAIERENKYNNRIIFQEHGESGTEKFILNDRFPDLYVLNREISLQHTPHSRLILQAQLLTPFTDEEVVKQKREEVLEFISALLLPGIILFVMGWWFNMLAIFMVIYAITVILMVLVFRHYQKRHK